MTKRIASLLIASIFLVLSSPLIAHSSESHTCCPDTETKDPIDRINHWFNLEKHANHGHFHRLVCLCTATEDNLPKGRMIEIVSLDAAGALFFTHINTQKYKDLAHNPHAAMNAWLPETHRQFTIEGTVAQISDEQAALSWKRMPRRMQLTFMASDHESAIENYDALRARYEELDAQFPGEIPMPPVFVGYLLTPQEITFFEIRKGDFPLKRVATMSEEGWTETLMQP